MHSNETSPSRRRERHARQRHRCGLDRAERPVVFVVDDDHLTQDLLRDVAHGCGWEARVFASLSDVRATLARSRPTLIILDDDLPDGSGGDLAREMRHGDIPLLVCTAADLGRVEEIGEWVPVVTKPFRIGEIEAFLAARAPCHEARGPFRGASG